MHRGDPVVAVQPELGLLAAPDEETLALDVDRDAFPSPEPIVTHTADGTYPLGVHFTLPEQVAPPPETGGATAGGSI